MKALAFLLTGIYLLFCLAGCDSKRLYEQHKTFSGSKWAEDSLAVFEVNIPEPGPVNIFYTVRNTESYPFCNLYVTYYIINEKGAEIAKALQDIPIADAVTGEPYGDGTGGIYDSRVLAISGFNFPAKGKYTIKLKQYMRKAELPGLQAIGIRLEKATK